MKKHHMIHDVQENLRINSIKNEEDYIRTNYSKEINTDGIINFIIKDRDVIKHFIVNDVDWFEEHDAIIEYFDKTIGNYDRNRVVKALNQYGYQEKDTRFVKLYALYPILPAFLFAVIIAGGNGMGLYGFVMVMMLVYLVIIPFPIAYVLFYEKKERIKIWKF